MIRLLWPSGWFDFNKARAVDIVVESSEIADPQSHRIFPDQANGLENKANAFKKDWDAYAPWKVFATVSCGPILNAATKFAQGQVWVDETRIACALERYRLVHGAYPGSLDALVPADIPELPRDIITGDPYHYQLRPDGTFLLYSVGWNQTDDGGAAIYKTDSKIMDYAQGDWPWPTPQAPKP